MTNTMLRRALQLFGRKVKVRVNVVRGESKPIVVGEGWDTSVVTNIAAPEKRHGGLSTCPECQQEPVTCIWEMWENTVTENDFRHIEYYWCANAHMWIETESHHDQVLAGEWG